MRFIRGFLSEESLRKVAKNRRVHLANERTFLAWIRTSLGIMAFGIVIEKVVLPMECLHSSGSGQGPTISKAAPFVGALLVIMGALTGVLATIRFVRTERDIMRGIYRPSIVADSLIAIMVAAIGILLALYLVFPS